MIDRISTRTPLLGVLAGGQGRRMGGCDKSQLPAPEGSGETLLGRLLRLGHALGWACVVAGGPAREGVQVVADIPPGIGPIGGLHALLAHAGDRALIAVACDMPFVSGALLQRLAAAPAMASVLAARDPESGKWQPWFARYDAARVRPALGAAIAASERSLQRFLQGYDVEELVLQPAEHAQLRDWDEPSDVQRSFE